MQMYAKAKSFHFIKLFFFFLFYSFSGSTYATPAPFDRIVIFGDSLSDTGNASLTSGGAAPCQYFYYKGRFSNGPIWVEHLAKALDLDPDSPDQFVNYAFGGAWASDDISYDPNALYKLSYEIEDYINERSEHGEKEANHLFVMWIGSNDYLSGDPNVPLKDATKDAIEGIRKNMDLLIQDGARNFLFLNLTDLGNTPKSREKGQEYVDRVSALAKIHNEKLAQMLADQRVIHPEIKIYDFDITPYFNDLMKNPANYGNIHNVTDNCYDGDYVCFDTTITLKKPNHDLSMVKRVLRNIVKANAEVHPANAYRMTLLKNEHAQETSWQDWKTCSNPDDYVYWDKLHPTATVHRQLANFVIDKLKISGVING